MCKNSLYAHPRQSIYEGSLYHGSRFSLKIVGQLNERPVRLLCSILMQPIGIVSSQVLLAVHRINKRVLFVIVPFI